MLSSTTLLPYSQLLFSAEQLHWSVVGLALYWRTPWPLLTSVLEPTSFPSQSGHSYYSMSLNSKLTRQQIVLLCRQLCAHAPVFRCNCLLENKTLTRAYVKQSVIPTLFVSVFLCIIHADRNAHTSKTQCGFPCFLIDVHLSVCQCWSPWTLSVMSHTHTNCANCGCLQWHSMNIQYSNLHPVRSDRTANISELPEASILNLCRTLSAFRGHDPTVIFLSNLFLWLAYFQTARSYKNPLILLQRLSHLRMFPCEKRVCPLERELLN